MLRSRRMTSEQLPLPAEEPSPPATAPATSPATLPSEAEPEPAAPATSPSPAPPPGSPAPRRRGARAALPRAAAWTALAAVLALGSAGLVGQLSHPPGDARRAELTYTADLALAPRLDDIAARLTTVQALVEGLAGDAKAALEAVASGDVDALQTALERGTTRSSGLKSTVEGIQSSLAGLPGEGPTAATVYGNATLVRRAALLAALDSVNGLAGEWGSVTSKAREAASLQVAIRKHDETVAQAATRGVAARYADAIALLGQAGGIVDSIAAMRADFVTSTDVTVLDDWIDRHRGYDEALLALYTALKASGGVRNPVVDAAYRAENTARQNLPPNNGAIVVIMSQVSQGGLNQAVIAIEDASGRIDRALAAIAPS